MQFELISELIEHYIVTDDLIQADGKKMKHVDRLNEITIYMYSNYKQPITLNDLANKQFLSVPYLSKFIKEQLGVTFTEYLNSIRLNYAIEDVINTDLPITRIALENGFATTFIFNKCFRENFNMTPNQYRKKFKQVNKIEYKNIAEIKDEIVEYLSESKLHKNLNDIFVDEVNLKNDL